MAKKVDNNIFNVLILYVIRIRRGNLLFSIVQLTFEHSWARELYSRQRKPPVQEALRHERALCHWDLRRDHHRRRAVSEAASGMRFHCSQPMARSYRVLKAI